MKKWPIITGVVAGVLAVGYGAGCYYFNSHFLPNTTLNGSDVSYATASMVQKSLTELETDVFTITEREGETETISLEDIGYEVSLPEERITDAIDSQNSFSWPVAFFNTYEDDVTIDYSYDNDKLEEEIDALDATNTELMVAPENAYIGIVDDSYALVEEVLGTTLDVDATKAAIQEALSNAQLTVDLEEADVYSNPEVTSDDETLKTNMDLLAKVNYEVITVDVQYETTMIDADTLIGMLSLDDSGNVSVNSEALNDYVAWIAETYETYKTTRQFTDHDGNVITVGGSSQDSYGFLLNDDSTYAALESAILSGQTQTVSCYWDLVGHTRNSVNEDIGTTYIEIDISLQQLYYYVDGSLTYQTNVITGLPEHNQSTPCGVFRIWAKTTNEQLTGTAYDGTEWDSTVAYWMPIDWTGVGLHDATWQSWSSWSSSAYKSVGSHGCVNLSYSSAEYLFYNTISECPVIIHD